jgi:hypothetical protein
VVNKKGGVYKIIKTANKIKKGGFFVLFKVVNLKVKNFSKQGER